MAALVPLFLLQQFFCSRERWGARWEAGLTLRRGGVVVGGWSRER